MKKRNQKRWLAMLMCWTMLLTNVCLPAPADETEAPSCAHTSTETREEAGVAAACTADGSHTVITVCADCGQELSRSTVTDAALGHAYSASSELPTCTEAGKVVYACSRCGDTYTEAGEAALGHDYQETTRTEATWDAEGSVTYICSRCEDSYHQVLPRLEKPEDPEQPEEPEQPEDPESPAVPFEQTETVDDVKITVTAPADVFDADAKLNISKTGNSDFTAAVENALDINAGERVIIRHAVYSFSGAEMNGSAQAKMERMKLTDLLENYPEGTVSVYVLRYDANAQNAADQARRVSADVNVDGNSISFGLPALGLYDVVTVVRLPEKTGNPGEEATEESAEESLEEPAEKPAEELTQKPTEESTEEAPGEPTVEPGEELTDEPAEKPAEELTQKPTEEPTEEASGESADEPGEELTGEPAEESAGDPTVESTEESAEEPAGELTADPAAAPETEEQAGLDGDSEPETEAEPFVVTISASYEGELCFGSTVTLTAVLSVDDPTAVVTWEYSPDGGHTVFVVEDEHSNTLTFIYSEDTKDFSWRAAVNRTPAD